VLNVKDKRSTERISAKLRIADDIGHAYARYGLALTVGRVFGLLLASDQPLSLDEIAEQLGVSKSGASVAARDLERSGIVRRLGTAGSRRVVYEATDQMELILAATFARVRDSLGAMNRAEPMLAPGTAKRRMRSMVEFHEFWLREGQDIIERWQRRRQKR
jgi:predicted transcriptional regulator